MSEKHGKIAVIGGSGVYKMEGAQVLDEHRVETPFGEPSDAIIEAEVDGKRVYFLPRHGRGHSYLPHEVNYRANIFALKKLGVKYVISVSAVGSLREELPPQTFVLPDQFIDWTKGKRERSFFEGGMVGHVSVAEPIDSQLQDFLHKSTKAAGVSCSRGGSYLCIEGPQFSSKAESQIYRNFGASVIGMTNVPESYLAKEAGMAYATIAMVTDYDNWKEEHCTVEEVMKVMKENNISANKVLKDVIPKLSANKFDVLTENELALMTPKEKLNENQRNIIEVLFR